MVRRVAQTLGEANDMFHTRFGETVDLLKQFSPNSRQGHRERAGTSERQLSAERPDDDSDVGEQHQGSVDLKMISKAVPSQEGELWTNKFQS